MDRMGGTCSMQRQREIWQDQENSPQSANRNQSSQSNGESGGRASRYSVTTLVPDTSIYSQFPVENNYVSGNNNSRSPKTLGALCVDTICRTLPYLDGELPVGLPQDVVDDIVNALVERSAINATTLRALRNCELSSLCLKGSRGVTDDWLKPLCKSSQNVALAHSLYRDEKHSSVEKMELDDQKQQQELAYWNADEDEQESHYAEATGGYSTSSCSTSSFVSAQYQLPPEEEDDDEDPNELSKPQKGNISSDAAATPMEDVVFLDHKISQLGPFAHNTSSMTILDLRGSQHLTDNGLSQLQDLFCLEVAKFDNCHSLKGNGLLSLSSSLRLHTLSLANCRRLTDIGLINVSHLASLKALSLDGCRCITDRSLAAISGLVKLERLDLSQCDLITDTGIKHLEQLDSLEELSLGWCRSITDRGLSILSQHPGRGQTMKRLRLSRCMITDEGIEHVGTLSALEELDVNGCVNVGSQGLGMTLQRLSQLKILDVSYSPGILRASWQGKISMLKSLDLRFSGVRDSHLARLVDLPRMEELNLESCLISDWAIAHLADNGVMPNLRSLDVADTELTDRGMTHLPKFKKLTYLSLFYCNISNNGLRYVAQLKSLESLNIDSRDISDYGLCHLSNLKKLKSLDVFSGRVTDAGCAQIAKIKSLESLEICGGGVGDLGCTFLSSLQSLTTLNLAQNDSITNRGVASLAGMKELRSLNLSNTRITAVALRFLARLVNLQSLALYGCHGIEHGANVRRLQDALPNLRCLRLNPTSEDDGKMINQDRGREDQLFHNDGDFDGEAQNDQSSSSDSSTDLHEERTSFNAGSEGYSSDDSEMEEFSVHEEENEEIRVDRDSESLN